MPAKFKGSEDTPGPIHDAATMGDRLALLVAMRDRCASFLDGEKTLARDWASLSKRLMELDDEIAALRTDGEDPVGEAFGIEDEAL